MTLKYLSEKICVAITNYGFSNNSEYLKESFSKYYHTILIDADSPNPPKNTDLSIKNTYYPGLWNAAVEYSVSHGYEWLMFVASDLQIDDIKLLCDLTNQATSNKDIGVYSPSLTADSRTAFGNLYNKSTSSIREAGVIEGFFFLARVEILRDIYPIPETNKSGWGVDVMTCYFSHKSNYLTVVDDRIKIYHPPSLAQHAINSSNGNQDALLYLGNEIVGWANSTHSTLSNNIKLLPTNSSLDLGCGTRIANPFNAASTFGIDIRESDNPNIRAADLNVEAIPFPDNYFDCVIMTEVM